MSKSRHPMRYYTAHARQPSRKWWPNDQVLIAIMALLGIIGAVLLGLVATDMVHSMALAYLGEFLFGAGFGSSISIGLIHAVNSAR